MYGIEVLVEEHRNILKLIECVKTSCYGLIKGEDVDTDLFRQYIEFARNYADKHHHGKEELILFRVMVEEMGPVAEKLVNYGMLIEHDYGRLYLTNLEEALAKYDETKDDILKLDIITNAMGYGAHIMRHIDKEDNVVYTFAERELAQSTKTLVDEETKQFETERKDAIDKYIGMLDEIYARVIG